VSINPYQMPSFLDWAQRMVPTLEQFGPIPFPPAETGWKTWASEVISLDSLAQRAAPSPLGFDDWKNWAAQFVGVIDDGF
jgi:hypothetical protein